MKAIRLFTVLIIVILFMIEPDVLYSDSKDIYLDSKTISLINTNKQVKNDTYLININKQVKNSSMQPHSIQVYNNIKKYCKIYNVPEKIAFKVAKLETGFNGPMDFGYKSDRTSSANAVGPMQLIYSTALYMSDDKTISYNRVKNDIELNVKLSIKYLRYLFDRYNNWTVACGAYNTGRPIINKYAIKATT